MDITGLPADSPELRIAALLDQYCALREERRREKAGAEQVEHVLVGQDAPSAQGAVARNVVLPVAPEELLC